MNKEFLQALEQLKKKVMELWQLRNDNLTRLPREMGSDGWMGFTEGEERNSEKRGSLGFTHTEKKRKGGHRANHFS